MDQEIGGRRHNEPERRRLGWGGALGLVLAAAGLALLAMVLMAVVLESGRTPASMAQAGSLPALIAQAAPALAPAPTRVDIDLPTPLPDELFSQADQAPQSGFNDGFLLPESPAEPQEPGQVAAGAPVRGSAGDEMRLVISAIGVDAPIQAVGLVEQEEDGRIFQQWQVPDGYAVGWHATSAPFGTAGNTVLNGHNNVHGAVFRDLVDLAVGDEIIVYDEDQQARRYQVTVNEVVEEKDQPLNVRFANARWMMPTADERLTLISCWPYIGNTHRVIVVATPVEGDGA